MTRSRHVLHIGPSVPYGAGNWKDIEARRLVLSELGVAFERWSGLSGSELCEKDYSAFDHLLIEYSTMGGVLAKIRKKWPHLKIHTRLHNAEPLQILHRSQLSIRRPGNLLTSAIKMLGALRQDRLTATNSDTLFGISPWDDEHYWRLIAPKVTRHYMPYFCPWPWLTDIPNANDWDRRGRKIVCMPGGRDRIGSDIVTNFESFASNLAPQASAMGWRFQITGGAKIGKQDTGPAIKQSEELRQIEPWELLTTARAVTVFTNLGFGMKTTIIDGLAAGLHVLVSPGLAKRLPENVRQCCKIVDPTSEISDSLLSELDNPPNRHARSINRSLRDQAVFAMEQTL